ncbi:hypothetical protein JHK82_026678 [Glycine max]|uniref:Uncharacterized protein n=1 Tax=Glycine max TaxID=3847 RepID=C6T322_SOYBN|nr:uncharacterized protein LOC100527023 [Glycine max]KAG4981810.1 hypothetical protein JHK87_026559 [Glycine soja]ACU16060.1 unknown [Glycine max]KAG4995858.1 hypothetical protein JHK85_027297 [Glycine max]KAG5002658.1 hypothetical protein JHK86_026797 [Glycine max]KAG5125843.1 hypothetical protein JHK82_026678 [Glycine max]|eukprot:NP_001351614.1 uncharacterized protein LOC100527023 [Glycine max]
MKSHISGESSLGNELRRSVSEKLHHVDEADAAKQGRVLKYIQTEKRRRRSHRAEDPIRTLMFLGSMNHT